MVFAIEVKFRTEEGERRRSSTEVQIVGQPHTQVFEVIGGIVERVDIRGDCLVDKNLLSVPRPSGKVFLGKSILPTCKIRS